LETLSYKEIGDEIANNLDILESENRDMPPRQRSVRAAFAHSWQRLSAAEQGVFMKLSVFRGGISRQAAEKIAGAGLRILRALVEKSLLIHQRPERFGIHELLRQFAAEKLTASGKESETRDIHSAYYLGAMEDREGDLKGRSQVEALEEIEGDLENVRTAWNWALRQRAEGDIAGAVEPLFLFFYMRSRYREGARLLHLARRNLASDASSRLLGRIIAREVWLRASYLTDHPELETDLEESLAAAQKHDDKFEIAFATLTRGYYRSKAQSDFAAALPFFIAGREQFERLDDKFYLAMALVRLGYCLSNSGDWDHFVELTRLGYELAQRTGNKLQIAHASSNLGTAALTSGDYDAAETYLNQSQPVRREMGDRTNLAHSSALLGLYHFLRGDLAQAKMLAANALAIATEIGWRITKAYALAVLSLEAGLKGEHVVARQLARDSQKLPSNLFGLWLANWALSIACYGLDEIETAGKVMALPLKDASDFHWQGSLTWLLPVAALLAFRAGQASRAVSLFSLAMNHPCSATGWIEQWSLLVEMQGELERELGREAYQLAWEQGRGLDLEKVVAELLAQHGG